MRSAILLLAVGALAAADPLLTDLRVVIGSGERDYSTGSTDDGFDSAVTADLAFVYGFRPLSEGTWFVGGAGRYASAEDSSGSDGLTGTHRRFMADVLAGYAVSPDGGLVHVEIGPYAGFGLARVRFVEAGTARSDIVPALEGGLRVAGYVTWNDALQVGIETGYGLVLSQPSVTSDGSALFANQGFTIALGLGLRVH